MRAAAPPPITCEPPAAATFFFLAGPLPVPGLAGRFLLLAGAPPAGEEEEEEAAAAGSRLAIALPVRRHRERPLPLGRAPATAPRMRSARPPSLRREAVGEGGGEGPPMAPQRSREGLRGAAAARGVK